MSFLDLAKGEKIHNRTIDISTFECDDERIIIEGELVEKRLQPYYTVKGELHDPDTVHHMRIRMQVDVRTLTIKDIEVEIIEAPHEECPELTGSLDSMKGMRIAPGFTSKVKDMAGGPAGCTHLTALLLAMAPAAVQGYWVHHARKPIEKEISGDIVEQYLVDTCRVWRKDGPLVERLARLKEQIE